MNIKHYLDSTYLKTPEQAGLSETENATIVQQFIQEAIDEGYDLYNFYGISGYFRKDEEGYGVFDYKRGYNAVVREYIGNFILPCKPFIFKIYNNLKHIY